jgi:hypothetical protein
MKGKSIILTELEEISPTVAQIPVKPVFSVPDGYFTLFPERMALIVRQMEDPNAEISEISPVLADISRKMPMEAPAGYFNNPIPIPGTYTESEQASVIPMRKKGFNMFAIAASVVALVGIFSVVYNQMNPGQPAVTPNVSIEIPKVSEQEMDNFLNAFPDTDISEPMSSATDEIDIEVLISDVNEKGLQDFLSDLPDGNNAN